MRDVIAEGNALVAAVATIAIDGHDSASAEDQFDARPLGTVTLAVSGLENARVSAWARSELGAEFLKELVGGFALVDMTAGEATRVQRATPGLRDEFLDEGAQFFRLGFGRFDRTLLDERGGEVAKQREALLTGPPKLAVCLTMALGN